ncbi:MAG: hypothetical protein KC912_04500 [Proteobacteria bacterium]|nr:hypothetical protein [Pseudomonadota bacterium]
MSELDDLLQSAQQHADAHHWQLAATHFTRAAQHAESIGERELSRRIWDKAGEAWRREDHPRAAARALRAALTLSSGDVEALAAVKLSAVLGELGRVEEAIRWARRGLVGATAPIARDTLIGHLLAQGKPDEAERWLPKRADGALGAARAFRVAQIARLRGQFDEAEEALDEALRHLKSVGHAASARAAALSERAEIYMLTGRPVQAVGLAEQAIDDHRSAGRRSMAWRAEASRVRALLAAGATAPPDVLETGIGFARVRELPLMEADLLLARSELRRAPEDARAVLALETGSWIREGRAFLLLAELEDDAAQARQALLSLAPSVPWSTRATELLGRLEG